LELFNHYLLEEPAWSDALNFRIMQILVSEDRRITAIRQAERPSGMDEQRFREVIRAEDALFLRFLMAKFRTRQPQPPLIPLPGTEQPGRSTEKDQVVEEDMSFASHLMGAVPKDQNLVTYAHKSHMPLNGYVYKFIRFWGKSLMFQIDGEPDDMCCLAPKLSDGAVYAAMERRQFDRLIHDDTRRAIEGEGAGPPAKLVLAPAGRESPPYDGPKTLDLEPP
jgi:hypothetical protein